MPNLCEAVRGYLRVFLERLPEDWDSKVSDKFASDEERVKIRKSFGMDITDFLVSQGFTQAALMELDGQVWVELVNVAIEDKIPPKSLRKMLALCFSEYKCDWHRSLMLYETAEGLAKLGRC